MTKKRSHMRGPPREEIEDMAALLEGRHGTHAAEVATFLADVMRQHGDPGRAQAWLAVGRRVDQRTLDRFMSE
jgi:hypothetical protein